MLETSGQTAAAAAVLAPFKFARCWLTCSSCGAAPEEKAFHHCGLQPLYPTLLVGQCPYFACQGMHMELAQKEE